MVKPLWASARFSASSPLLASVAGAARPVSQHPFPVTAAQLVSEIDRKTHEGDTWDLSAKPSVLSLPEVEVSA